MVEDMGRIAEKLCEFRVANGFDDVRVFTSDDSSFDYSVYATKGRYELELRRARYDRDDG